MEYVQLGGTGLRVSRLCLGLMSIGRHEERQWAVGEEEAEPIVRQAVEGGVTFFDTADVYNGGESEVLTGRILPKLLTREEYVLATKVHGQTMPGENGRGLGRKHILASIDGSLARLGLDYVDLYQIHRFDRTTPVEETMEALHEVVKSGKARYIGASSMYAWQFAKAQFAADAHGWTRFVSMQNHYNLVYREEEREMIPQCIDQGVAVLPWSPLARGLLAGNRTRTERLTLRANTDPFADGLYRPELDFDVVERVAEVAAERGVSSARLALAWLWQKPGVTAPIVGATRALHVEDALAAEQLELSAEEVARLEEPYVPHGVSGPRMIVVTGSTGHVGRLVAEELAALGKPMRLLVRDPARAPRLPGAEIVAGDYGDRGSLRGALQEGDRVFMVSLHEGPERRVLAPPVVRRRRPGGGRRARRVPLVRERRPGGAVRARALPRCDGGDAAAFGPPLDRDPQRDVRRRRARLVRRGRRRARDGRRRPHELLLPARAREGDRRHPDHTGPRAGGLQHHDAGERHAGASSPRSRVR